MTRRLRACWILCALATLLAGAVPALADEDSPFTPAEEHGFLRKESDQSGITAGRSTARSPSRPSHQAGTAATADELVGLFKVEAGECGADGLSGGSYFRMVQPSGTVQDGPFVENNNSSCDDKTYTLLEPGTDGGLSTSGYQPQNDPPFDATGNGTSNRIVQPARFFGTDFAAATNQVDPQTGAEVDVPSLTNDGGALSGDTRAFAASWNNQHFNQGSPKPDGGEAGLTAGPTGTFDANTNAYELEWSSTIVGGAFNNFTGVWHLTGSFDGSVDVGVKPASSPSGGGTGTGNGSVGASGGTGGAAVRESGPTARTGPSGTATSATGALLMALALAGRRAALRGRASRS